MRVSSISFIRIYTIHLPLNLLTLFMNLRKILILSLLFFSGNTFSQDIVAFTNLLQVCENDTVVFRDNSTLDGGATAVEYAWDFDGDFIFDSISVLDTMTHLYDRDDLQQNYASQHAFDVTLRIVTSLNDTLYSSPKEIKINYLPVRLTSGNPAFDSIACKLDEVFFFNNFYVAEGFILNTYWYFNDLDETYTQNYFSRTFQTAEEFNVKTTAFTDKGCSTSEYANLYIKEIPNGEMTYSGDLTFYSDKSLQLIVDGAFTSVLWNNDKTTPTINVYDSGIYTVTLTNDENCSVDLSSEEVTVLYEQPIDAMNLLTLNDDGKNDTWKIFEIEAYGTCEVTVFNRNGVVVFEDMDYQNTWDGKDESGNKLAEGAYFYVIRAQELADVKKGTINLVY